MKPLISLAILVILTGCAAPELPEGKRIDGRDWKLMALDGQIWPHDVSLRIDGDRLTGIGPCNAYSGDQAETPPGFAARKMDVTQMPCAAPARRTAEARYLAALGRAESIRREGAELVLTGPGTEMIFAPREARGDEVF